MSDFIDRLRDQLNLRWAWEKVRRSASLGDVWFDEVELAGFDLQLGSNLQKLSGDLSEGVYRLSPLKLLPYPKQKKDDLRKVQIRQMFNVTVRDQVAWTAVVNVVGPYVDYKMPPWSYGHRLYRPIWVEEAENGAKSRKIGRYRHSAGRLYLPFGQSWPIFRRHVHLATRAMAREDQVPNKNLDERTLEELALQEKLPEKYRCPFVMQSYWKNKRPARADERLYWCSVDLEKFYPSIRIALIRHNITNQLPPEWQLEAGRLLDSMLHFEIDSATSDSDTPEMMDLRKDQRTFSHIPTGLFVAGFLANAGLLAVDQEVAKRLRNRAVAHFRFVDDHIMLAYSLDDLIGWVAEYKGLLTSLHTGTRINRDKVQPKEFGRLIIYAKGKRNEKTFQTMRRDAEVACSLDPKFPSPLMTKTLALVSAIARTDFNLLELSELAALTNELEHLVLTEIPEEEIPEKTRLSFAATRLTRLVECRLATSTPPAELRANQYRLQRELELKGPADANHLGFDEDVAQLIRNEVERVFQLFRKVLRERYDSVRLWTRAIQMCRSTGVDGLSDLASDIDYVRRGDSLRKGNPWAAEYLRATSLSTLATQALIAAQTLQDHEAAHWRKLAARTFLGNLRSIGEKLQPDAKDPWFVQISWLQYCTGLNCSDLLLKDTSVSTRVGASVLFRENELAVGRRCVGEGSAGHGPAEWVWWAVRVNLERHPKPRQEGLAKLLGKGLVSSREAIAFWRFFPGDVPVSTLETMLQGDDKGINRTDFAGWWYDALRERPKDILSLTSEAIEALPLPVRRLLEPTSEVQPTLYDWTAFLRKLAEHDGNDPRCTEWTALEVVRQVAELVTNKQVFGLDYILAANTSTTDIPYIHPANFRIPGAWLKESEEPAWEEWQRTVKERLDYVAKTDRVQDLRYTPLTNNGLFSELNIARGLGLLLYGLLRKSFDLPAVWNGPGHADVLKKMPRLLLAEMTCSTWTLGILASCLLPRVSENLILQRYPLDEYKPDEDTLKDPILFLNGREIERAIEISQKNLQRFQLSTMGNRARQLTPVSIQQLTDPDWRKVFEMPAEDGDIIHE